MTRKSTARIAGNSGRGNDSGSELETLGAGVGDDTEADVSDANEVAHALVDSNDAERFLIVISG